MRKTVRALKRAIDVAGSAVGLAMVLPLFAPIAVAIKLDSKGPVFFRQRRAGQLRHGPNGFEWEEFYIVKFRTMGVDAEAKTGAVLAQKNDPRVTKVGGFLRKTRLDELPQFWNVLKGDMSLVGPRPERPELLGNLASAIPFFEERTRGLKPGLTGLAQISLGYSGNVADDHEGAEVLRGLANPFGLDEADGAVADDMRNKLLFDLAYAAALEDVWSYIRMEASILFKTPLIMIMSKGH